MYCWQLPLSEGKGAAKLRSKRLVKPAVVLLIAVLLSTPGCWDRRELEDLAFVESIGIDQAKNNQLAVTFRIAIPSKTGLGQSGGGGGGGGAGSAAEKASLLTTVIAPTIPAALVLASAYVNREMSLMHTKVFIFGESFAKQGVGRVLDLMTRYREIRRNILVCVAKGTAQKLISANSPDLEKSYAKYWEGVKLLESRLGLHPGSLLHDFMGSLESESSNGTMLYLAKNEKSLGQDPGQLDIPPAFKEGDLGLKAGEVPRLSGDPVEYLGTAVFKGDKFVNTLNYTETQAFLILSGLYKMGIITMQDPKNSSNFISLEIKPGSPPRISVDTSGDRVVIAEKVSLEGDLLGEQTGENYATNLANQHLLEAAFIKHLRELSTAMLKKQQNSGTDIVGYGKYAKRNFLTRPQWHEFDWPHKFKDAEFDLEFKFNIRRTGLQGKPPEIR